MSGLITIGKYTLKVFCILIIIALLAIMILLIINIHVKASTKDQIISATDASSLDVDCILVLGAGVWENNKPSPMLEDRLLQGIELYKNGASNRMLMSGDHSKKDYDEVNVMKDFAIEKEIPSQHIFMDHAGFSTYESIYRARDIFKVDKAIIVTQNYHLYRALYIANKLGIKAYGVASNPRPYAGQDMRDLREIFGRSKDFFSVIFKPEPTYLGEPIPIGGNGDITNDK